MSACQMFNEATHGPSSCILGKGSTRDRSRATPLLVAAMVLVSNPEPRGTDPMTGAWEAASRKTHYGT